MRRLYRAIGLLMAAAGEGSCLLPELTLSSTNSQQPVAHDGSVVTDGATSAGPIAQASDSGTNTGAAVTITGANANSAGGRNGGGGSGGVAGGSGGKVAGSSGGESGSGGSAVAGGSASGAGREADQDVCASSVCTPGYPCEPLTGGGYMCRGQFPDWPPAYNRSSFKDNGDGTVTDSRNGLVWQRTPPSPYPGCSARDSTLSAVGTICSVKEAEMYCAGLSLAGTGWRLPTQVELESLVDDTLTFPAIDTSIFPGASANGFTAAFLSSSPYVGSSDGDFWFVDFGTGATQIGKVQHAVRCVK